MISGVMDTQWAGSNNNNDDRTLVDTLETGKGRTGGGGAVFDSDNVDTTYTGAAVKQRGKQRGSCGRLDRATATTELDLVDRTDAVLI